MLFKRRKNSTYLIKMQIGSPAKCNFSNDFKLYSLPQEFACQPFIFPLISIQWCWKLRGFQERGGEKQAKLNYLLLESELLSAFYPSRIVLLVKFCCFISEAQCLTIPIVYERQRQDDPYIVQPITPVTNKYRMLIISL